MKVFVKEYIAILNAQAWSQFVPQAQEQAEEVGALGPSKGQEDFHQPGH